MHFNFWALLSVFIVGVAGQCSYQTGFLRARDTATGSELGKVAIDLNSSGSFGLTTSTNSSLYARFQSVDDCTNILFYFTISNTKNTALPYMSLVSGVTNCGNAAFPGWLLLTPTDGGPKPLTPFPIPGSMLSTLQHDWQNPATFCGETWNFGTIEYLPSWRDPNGTGWPKIPLYYDPSYNRLVAASSYYAYPNWAATKAVVLEFVQ